jgi:DNA polymerase-1
MKERILIIDGLNTFIRSWAVVPSMNTNGEHVGGVVGTLRSIKFAISEVKPSKVIVVWDGEGGSRKRRSVYSEYKAGRKPKINRQFDFDSVDQSRANMMMQQAKTKQLIELLGMSVVEISDIEADDTIGYLCTQMYAEKQKVIMSTDKDFYQLIDAFTIVYSPSKKMYYSSSAFQNEYGVLPENYILVKALKGDASDNVKGLSGIGDKTAVKLFPMLGERPVRLDELLAIAETNRAKNPKYEAVIANRDLLIGNVQLMQLTSPVISAKSAMLIRNTVEQTRAKFTMSEFKLALIKDGIQIIDVDFFTVFKEYAMNSGVIDNGA